jgi:hypothetical protein
LLPLPFDSISTASQKADVGATLLDFLAANDDEGIYVAQAVFLLTVYLAMDAPEALGRPKDWQVKSDFCVWQLLLSVVIRSTRCDYRKFYEQSSNGPIMTRMQHETGILLTAID